MSAGALGMVVAVLMAAFTFFLMRRENARLLLENARLQKSEIDLLREDNERKRKEIDNIRDKYDTVLYELADLKEKCGQDLGILVAEVEQAKLRKQAKEIEDGAASLPLDGPGKNPDQWKKRRGNA